MRVEYSGWGSNFLKALISMANAPREGSLNAKFTFKGTFSTNRFSTDRQANECFTTLSLTVFTQTNFVAAFLQAKCDFIPKTAVLRFEPPFGQFRGNVR